MATRSGSDGKSSAAKGTGTGTNRRRARTSEAGAAGATARARIISTRTRARTTGRTKRDDMSQTKKGDMPMAEPTATVPADDAVLAASNAKRALSPDMPRVAWLRTQLLQMEHRQREQLVKVFQLTLIAIVFITFVLQNAQPVNVHFLLFSVDIRLIWVIFGCGLLGAAAGYLIGRPDKSLRALLPQKDKQQPPAAGRTSSV